MSDQEQAFLTLAVGLLLIVGMGWKWRLPLGESTHWRWLVAKWVFKLTCGLAGLSFSLFGILKLAGYFQGPAE